MAGIELSVLLLAAMTLPCTTRADDGYFWHITDYHYDSTYWSEMLSCNEEVPARGIYGDYSCDSPWELITDSISSMADIKTEVDFILWTGDTVAHIKNEYINESFVLDIISKTTEALKTKFPGVKVYATMGNNDWHPANQFPADTHRHRLYNDIAELWEDWISEPDQLNNFRKGAYYTLTTTHGLRIVCLNTNIYSTRDILIAGQADPTDQFSWLETVLNNAKEAGEKVLLTAHIPPGVHTPGGVVWFTKAFNTRFVETTGAFSDTIVGMYFGHDHVDGFKVIPKPGGGPGIPMFMAPSLTPRHSHNPAIRLVKYNRRSSLPLDIHQYYMDLAESNKNNAASWTIAYKASEAYGVSDLSAISLTNVIKKMKTDKATLDKYIGFNTVQANGETRVNACDETCRVMYICGFTYMDRASFETCVTAHGNSEG